MLFGDMKVLEENHLLSVKDDNSRVTGGVGRRMCLISAVPRAAACVSDSFYSRD